MRLDLSLQNLRVQSLASGDLVLFVNTVMFGLCCVFENVFVQRGMFVTLPHFD